MNDKATEFFGSLCTTEETKKLDNMFLEYAKLMNYENFDCYFEEYLRIDEI